MILFVKEKILVSACEKSKIESKKCEEHEKYSACECSKIESSIWVEMWTRRDEFVKTTDAFEIRCFFKFPFCNAYEIAYHRAHTTQ